MNEKGAGYTMRRVLAFALCALLLLPLASASEAGINKVIDLSGTPIAAIDTPSISHDGDVFDIAVTLSDEAASNGTTVAWTWQVCINTGVCLTPVPENLSGSNDGKQWSATMTPVDEHSYVNFKVTLSFADGNSSNYPETGFGGKIWSDCWIAGNESGGGACSNGDGGVLPALGLVGVLSALGLGAAVIRRD
jgi:hypothetical protein